MVQAFFNHKRQENFNRGSEFVRQIINVILIIPFMDYQFAVFVDAEVFGIEFLFPELPEFFKVFQFSLCISGSGHGRKFLLESVPMKKSPPPFFRDSLGGLDTWFAGEYGRELQELDRSNFHARATDLLDLQNGDIHVDLCAGPAHFLAPLKQKQQGAIIVGIEESAVMIKKAVEYLGSKRMGCVVVDGGRQAENVLSQSGPIAIIQEDVRRMNILKRLLNGRQVDSASLMLPMPVPSLGMCEIGERKPTQQAMKTFLLRIIHDTRRLAYRFMSNRVKRGGKIVLADGRGDDNIESEPWPEESTVFNLVAMTRIQMGRCAKYWESDQIGYRNKLHDTGDIQFVSTETDRPLPPIEHKNSFFAHCLVRNDKPYRED